MDIGQKIVVDKENVFCMSAEIMKEDRMVTPVQLDHPKLSPEEKSAVECKIEKMVHRRFTVKSINAIVPNAIVDLIDVDGKSILSTLQGIILKRFKIEDIPSAKVLKRRNVDLTIIDNTHLTQGIVSCVLKEQLQHFANQTKIVCQYGEKMVSERPYDPEKNELCVVRLPDDDGTQMYYRAQFQQKLVNGKVQVGLMDFNATAIVPSSGIRRFDEIMSFERINFLCKIRSTQNCSLDLLREDLFDLYDNVTAALMEPAGDSYGIAFDMNYFDEDENIEDLILQLEDY